jgi:hypothetical protein
MSVDIYSTGLCYVSVCTDIADREAIEAEVNKQHPTGIESQWHIADEPFGSGLPNPTPCTDDETRLHYLLSC